MAQRYIKPPKKSPKILFLDIETTPLLIANWDTGKQYVGHNQIIEDRSVLSWSAKWQSKRRVMYFDTRSRRDKRDDRLIIKEAHKALSDADVVVWQNGKRFDEKILNARFLHYGLGEPSSYQSVDTLQIMKQRFKLPSYSLGYVVEALDVGEKYTSRPVGFNGLELWLKCLGLQGSKKDQKKAFDVMEKYNSVDTIILERVWEKISPWARGVNYVNPNLYITNFTKDGKPKDYICQCGSVEFRRNGYSETRSGRYLKWVCKVCKANHREKGNGKNLRPQKRGRV
jgi:uncharacterized protein YprB with RNaseH-like and TPR domain